MRYFRILVHHLGNVVCLFIRDSKRHKNTAAAKLAHVQYGPYPPDQPVLLQPIQSLQRLRLAYTNVLA